VTAVRVGLAGCGRIAARGYVPALARTPGVELVAVADVDPGRCAAIAPSARAFGTVEQLLGRASVDLLVLAHPASEHVPDALRAAAAGVTTLVEKPPARSAAELGELLDVRPAPWLGLNRRFEPETVSARARLRDDAPASLELEMSILPSAWGAFSGSEPVLLDLGPHLVDLALWLTGRDATRLRVERASAAEASFALDLDGVTASLRVSHARAWRERAVARLAGGREVTLIRRGGLQGRVTGRLRGGMSPLVASLAAQLAAVAAVVRGEPADERLASVADGLAVMRVLDAVAGGGRDWISL
jgi:predicted dehydrogenase